MMLGGRPSRIPVTTIHSPGRGAQAMAIMLTAATRQPVTIRSLGRSTRSATRPPSGTDTMLIQSAAPVMRPASLTEDPRDIRKLGAKLATTMMLALSSAQPAPALTARSHTRRGTLSRSRAALPPAVQCGSS
jgi:hypothetical protein